MEEPAPPVILKKLLSFSERDKIPTVIGTDANAYHTVWGSSNVNTRGTDLFMYCASVNLLLCNVGNKPTFRTRKREEVLDLTLINRNAENCISDYHVQAYADDVAILVTGTNMLWIKGRTQKALNIASNWAHSQERQFTSKKTEIVLFTNKRKTDFGTLRLNGRQLEISKEATLLGVTLDSKLAWKPQITRTARKTTAALLQIVGRAWGLNPTSIR